MNKHTVKQTYRAGPMPTYCVSLGVPCARLKSGLMNKHIVKQTFLGSGAFATCWTLEANARQSISPRQRQLIAVNFPFFTPTD
jgi:hypothetical protein